MPDGDPATAGALRERAETVDLYKLAVDEYRFQVQLNWSRAQYMLAFNTAVVGAGAGLVRLGGTGRFLVAGVFFVGMLASVLSMFAVYVQHGYYESARDHVRYVGDALALGDLGIATTPGMKHTSKRRRLGKVQTVLYLLLSVLAAVDIGGLVYALFR